MVFNTVLVLASFLIGGIPTGYLIVQLFKSRDIRDYGSGNIGFSNVWRTEGLVLGLLVLAIDVGKAFTVTYFFSFFFVQTSLFRLILGIAVILGNIFTPFLKFRGGKGVATSLGVAIALNPYASLCALVVFVITVKLSRYMSLGSLIAVFVYTLASFIFYATGYSDIYTVVFAALIFVAIVVRHISNIKRLIHGQENKIGSGRDS
jgi:glycerol-3-phosphate acyltransferase PlsY